MSGHTLVVDRWACGTSQAPFDRANVGVHVGDDRLTVASNRAAAAALAGIDFPDIVIMSPVHGNTVHVVRDLEDIEFTDIGRVAPPADALVTQVRGIALMVMGADCAPVTVHGLSPVGEPTVAVIHVGWKGLAANVMAHTLRHFQAESVKVAIHPSICGQHYPVPKERGEVVPGASVVACHDGQVGIDVRAGILQQCQELGIGDIEVDPRCTFESPNFISHRRDGVTGRFAVMAWL